MSINSFLPEPKRSKTLAEEDQIENYEEIYDSFPSVEPSGDLSTFIARQNQSETKIIQTSFKDLIPLRQKVASGKVSLSRPSEQEILTTAQQTKAALDKIIQSRVDGAKPKATASTQPHDEATYVRYESSNVLDQSKNKERLLKIVDKQQDPMLPAKFKKKKIPGGPPSPPVPILHSPPRKLTAQDHKNWYIPPAISNWKNPKGFTIAIDKRLASSQAAESIPVNEKFTDLAVALENADRDARQELKLRASINRKLAEKEAREKEEQLRQLAHRARNERFASETSHLEDHSKMSAASRREAIRAERRTRAERELRMSKVGSDQRTKLLAQDRHISERVALGVSRPSAPTAESHFDSRLFSRGATSNVKSSEDQFYDKPLFAAQEAVTSIYRPNVSVDTEEYTAGPVEFEEEDNSSVKRSGHEDFGMNEQLSSKQSGSED